MDQASESPRFAVHMSPAPGAVIAPTGELDIASVPALRGNSAQKTGLVPEAHPQTQRTPVPVHAHRSRKTERSLPDRAESRSLAESTAWATKQKPMGLAQLRSIAATMLSANSSGRERNG